MKNYRLLFYCLTIFGCLIIFISFNNITKSADTLYTRARTNDTVTLDCEEEDMPSPGTPSNRSSSQNRTCKTTTVSDVTNVNQRDANDNTSNTYSDIKRSDPVITPATGMISHDLKVGNANHKYLDVNRSDPEIASVLRDDSMNVSGQVPIVLFWSDGPRNMWWITPKEGSEYFKRCQLSCAMTRNKSLVTEASVVVFFHVELQPVWPKSRFQNQSYVHFLNERPGPWHESMTEYNGRINITWCSRRDADVPSHPIVLTKTRQLPGKVYTPRIPLSKKTKSVVWPVSNCNASSNRDIYAHELSKHIDVDIYGRCGSLACLRSRECMEYFERTYKFYLSFENSICKDYITEKFYTTTKYELIPIVMGGGDYNEAGPPHSFINVRDYDSPKDLAKYLHFL